MNVHCPCSVIYRILCNENRENYQLSQLQVYLPHKSSNILDALSSIKRMFSCQIFLDAFNLQASNNLPSIISLARLYIMYVNEGRIQRGYYENTPPPCGALLQMTFSRILWRLLKSLNHISSNLIVFASSQNSMSL